MSNIHRLPDMATVTSQASEWIARLHADNVTAEDQVGFIAWHDAHRLHADVYAGMLETLNEVKQAGQLVRAVSFANAMNAATQQEVDRPAMARMMQPKWFALAAMLLIAVASVLWVTRDKSDMLFQTAIGEHAAVELPDGSKLELNSNSAAQVDYSAHRRIIRLVRGEAFFEVAHDTQRPFWVMAGQSWVRAVGTAFNVDRHSSDMNVLVSEGVVKLARVEDADKTPSDAVLSQVPVSILKAGQQARIHEGVANIGPVSELAAARLSAWRKGNVYFENQDLETVIEEFSRYTTERIIIDDDALRKLPVGGMFKANSRGIEALLSTLRDGFGLRVRRVDGQHIHIDNPPSSTAS